MTSNPHFDAGAGEDAVMRGKGGEKQHVHGDRTDGAGVARRHPKGRRYKYRRYASESTNTPPPAHATVDIAGLTRNRFVDAGRPGPCGCSMEARGVTAEPSAGRYYRGMSAGIPRVAITGIGVVSPFGVGRERFWQHIQRGCSGTRAITDFDASPYPCMVAAPVPALTIEEAVEFDPRVSVDGAERSGHADPRRYSKASLIAVVAASEAWKDAGLRANEPGAGVLVGSGAGGIDVAEKRYFEFFNQGWKRVTPYAIPVSIVGMISSEISIALELHGISHVVSTGCTSSTDALSYAAALIRAGDADVVLSGGADACVTPGMIFGFSKMRAVSTAFNETPGGSLATVRFRARRLRPRRRRVDARPRA